MRYRELLEAPLADLEFRGSDEPVSLRADDIRAANSPAWRARVEKLFRTTKHEVNLLIMNQKVIPHERTTEYGGKAFTPGLRNIGCWAGLYEKDDFQTTFGFLPKNFENRINIILLFNDGDGRLPLTPWMVGHRFIHGLMNPDTEWWRNTGIIERTLDDAYNDLRAAVLKISDATRMSMDEVQEAIGTFASAKNGSILRSGEFYIEVITQAFLKGKFSFDYSSLRNKLTDDDVQFVEHRLAEAQKNMTEAFNDAVGKLVVF